MARSYLKALLLDQRYPGIAVEGGPDVVSRLWWSCRQLVMQLGPRVSDLPVLELLLVLWQHSVQG